MGAALSDLHRHLDGSLRPATVAELAARAGRAVPADLKFQPGMGLASALSKFEFLLSLLQHPAEVRRVAAEMCEDAAGEGVTTLEIRFAPQLHRGASAEVIIDAAVEGAAGRAGIVLCGLYGEPPEVLESLVRHAAARPGVVGIDLAGGPASGHSFALRDYAGAYRQARELGLGRTVHAGEGRPPREIIDAIELLGAQRIGHGTTLLDDPRAVALVIERGVTIEACLTSNVHTGVIASQLDHPIAHWVRAGVRVCLCADNTFLSDTDADTELAWAARLLDTAALEAVRRAGHAAAFRRGAG
jgi:adenosine deaminase